MRIRWFGHACFEIRNNITIVTDPHDGKSIGLKPPAARAQIVLMSHDHFDHNCARLVSAPDAKLFSSPILTKELGVELHGIESYHDNAMGAKRGLNTVFRFVLNNIAFCHLGDLGHILSDDTIRRLKPIDILFIPVGNVFTIGPADAKKLVEKMQPKVIIPMHYRVAGLSLSIKPVDAFLQLMPPPATINVGNEIIFEKEDLPEEQRIWVFTYL
jgi:L-ascorbate metabolism protein UlaG (beta-lactamase superfamily)